MDAVLLGSILATAVLVASMVSVEAGVSVALIELALGIALGNVFNLNPDQAWLVFIASFAGVVLTFLAGAEVDPDDFRARFWPSVGMGVASFVGPFVVATTVAIGPLGWTTRASLIAGTALSTTSLAVVYAVLVETRPEQRQRFVVLFALMVLGAEANSQAILPAFVLGLVMSRHYRQHQEEQRRLRVVAFAFLTPFFFLRGGLNVSLSAVVANLGILAALATAKMVPKLGLVYPLARRHVTPNATFTTLLMSTGLTFGTISALYGLTAHIIDRTQFSLLVTVVVLSAIVPTAIAQRWFSPPIPADQPHHLMPPDPSEILIGGQ